MGILLSILFSYVGAVELAFIVRDIVHQICLHHQQIEQNQSLSNDLEQIQQHIRKSLEIARLSNESDNIKCMQDGVRYENGYRIDDIVTVQCDNDDSRSNLKANNNVCNYSDDPQSMNLNSVKNNIVDRKNTIDTENDSSQTLKHEQNSVETTFKINNEEITKTNKNEIDVGQSNQIVNSNHDLIESINKSKKHSRHNNRSSPIFGSEQYTQLKQSSDDEVNDPWGDVKPELFHDTELWKRERRLTIPEIDIESGITFLQAKNSKLTNIESNELEETNSTSAEDDKVCAQEKVFCCCF